MALNPELLKLVGILAGGIIVLVIGFIQTQKKKKKHEKEMAMMNQNYSNSSQNSESESLSSQEKSSKTYIEQYKSMYPRESIKSALVNNGNSEEDVENWLNKYF